MGVALIALAFCGPFFRMGLRMTLGSNSSATDAFTEPLAVTIAESDGLALTTFLEFTAKSNKQ